MSAALKWNLVSVEDYLAAEEASPIKHEYVGGVVHAMAGASFNHNVISSNVLVAAANRVRGKGCRALGSDMRLRIQMRDHFRFYYPEVSVVCRPKSPDNMHVDEPVAVFEVLSRSTRRTDLGEKKDAYLTIPSLNLYVLVEQDEPVVVVYRRTATGFVREVYEGLTAVVPLPEIDAVLPLAEVYDGVEFVPESPAEDELR
jgi:Uma2 family endonuclease